MWQYTSTGCLLDHGPRTVTWCVFETVAQVIPLCKLEIADLVKKTVGSWNLVQIEAGLEAFSLRLFTQLLGWTTEDVQTLLANVRKDLRNPKIHAQFDLYVNIQPLSREFKVANQQQTATLSMALSLRVFDLRLWRGGSPAFQRALLPDPDLDSAGRKRS